MEQKMAAVNSNGSYVSVSFRLSQYCERYIWTGQQNCLFCEAVVLENVSCKITVSLSVRGHECIGGLVEAVAIDESCHIYII
jgi:hypothetical protein